MKLSGQAPAVIRRLILGLALAVSLAAAFLPEKEAEISVVGSVERKSGSVRERPQRQAMSDIPGIAVLRSTKLDPEGDPFRQLSWKPELPPQKPEPPPPPAAPPLPYSYLGQMDDGGKPIFFLGNQENNFAVRVGDTVENVWHLDDASGNRLSFTYLPLKLGQAMNIGGSH